MEAALNEIRDQQKNVWNRFSSGWKKWDDFTMDFLKQAGEAIITELNIKESDNVLDVACGTGEPGLTIAGLAKQGKVTGTDLADQMLDIAKEKAISGHIDNFETKVCDVCDLPFGENEFDKISCRMGFMFFPDTQLASDQMYRVLKPGGKMATSVWAGPDKNVWVSALMKIINKNIPPAPPTPDGPGMFRCANTGYIKNLLEKSGFKNVKVQEVDGKVLYESFNTFWQMMNEVAAPVVGALSKADTALVQKIKDEVEQFAEQYKTADGLEMNYGVLVISGDK